MKIAQTLITPDADTPPGPALPVPAPAPEPLPTVMLQSDKRNSTPILLLKIKMR